MKPADWLDRRILITVGTGGVGKTTIAAALGLAAAARGRRVLVLTIDPARRLADALGLSSLDPNAAEIPREVLKAAGVDGSGSLAAMMLDTKRSFDELVQRYAPDEETRERIVDNKLYQHLSDALAGSREYSALEKLYQIHAANDYDLIVLDTPPAAHALDFLDAPRRLTGFLDSPILRLMLRPALAVGRTGFRLFRAGSDMVLALIARVTGMELLRLIAEFLLAFETLWDGISARAREVERLLRSPDTGFVLVVGPDPVQVRRAREFWERLQSERIELLGAIVNRVRRWPEPGPIPELPPATREALAQALAAELDRSDPPFATGEAARALVDLVGRYASLARRDAALREGLTKDLELGEGQTREVPLLAEDIHNARGLREIADRIFAESGRV